MKTLGKIILILLILCIILAVALFFFNKFYFSKILISKLTILLEEQTNRKVEIKNATFGLIKGLAVSGITIFDEHSPKAPFLKVNSLSLKIPFLPFRKSGKLNIPLSISADNIELSLIRKTENEFNFSSLRILKEKPAEKPKSQSKITVLPTGLRLTDIKIYFRDGFAEPTLSRVRDLSIKNANVQFSLPAKLNFNILGVLNPDTTGIVIKGEFLLPTKTLLASLNITNLPLEQYNAYYTNLPITIKGATIEKIATDISLRDKFLSAKTNATLKNISLENNDLKLMGEFLINADAEYNLSNKNINYAGVLKIINTNIAGINFLKEIDNINGDLNFSKDLLETKSLTGFILNAPLSLEGKMSDFTNPYLYLHILSDLNLPAVTQFLADNFKNIPIQLQGNAKLDAQFQGRLKEKESLVYSGGLDINEMQVLYAPLKEPINIQQTQIKLEKNKISSENINANYKNSSLQAKLLVDISRFDNINLNSNGDINLNLKDLGLEKLPLEGIAKANFRVNTKLGDLKNADINLKLTSDSLKIQGMSLKNFSTKYTQSKGSGSLNISSLDVYGGAIQLDANTLNLFTKDLIYNGNIDINNVDLAKLKLDTPLKDKDFSGIFNSYIEAQGVTTNLKNLTGEGNVEIRDGNIWEFKPLKAIAEFLRLKSQLQFSECSGTFSIKDKKVSTQDLNLSSIDKKIKLAVTGSVGFDKQLDLNVKTEATQDLLPEKPELMDIPGILLGTGLSQFNIKVTGSWDKPKILPMPVAIENFGKGIEEGIEKIKGIFGDILK